jgi:hypothetical protein
MKKYLICALFFAGFLLGPRAAHAVLVGTADVSSLFTPEGLATLLQGNATMALGDISKTTYTDLKTSLAPYGEVVRWKSKLYYANSKGIQRQEIGAATSTLLKGGSMLNVVAHAGSTLVVERQAIESQKAGSFFYSLSDRKSSTFSPAIGDIISADFSDDGSIMMMIAKNSAGKQKLYVSKNKSQKLKEYSLPKYATECSFLTLSPKGARVHLGCLFSIPNNTPNQYGSVLLTFRNDAFGAAKRWVSNVLLVASTWLSESRLVTIEADYTTQAITLNSVSISGTTVKKKTTLLTGTTSLTDTELIADTPASLVRDSASTFFYTDMHLHMRNDSPTMELTSAVWRYDLSAKTATMVLENGLFNAFLRL